MLNHPTIPFIRVCTEAEFGRLRGYDKHEDWYGSEDVWFILIDDFDLPIGCTSAQDAFAEAEEYLFKIVPDLGDRKIAEAKASGDIDLIITLVERKGYLKGRLDAAKEIIDAIKPAYDKIGLIAEKNNGGRDWGRLLRKE